MDWGDCRGAAGAGGAPDERKDFEGRCRYWGGGLSFKGRTCIPRPGTRTWIPGFCVLLGMIRVLVLVQISCRSFWG
jgi:hypothetical protein